MTNHLSPLPGAVIFDMDGLLLDTERLSYEAWLAIGLEFGYDIEPIYPQVIGKGVSACDLILSEHFGSEFPAPVMRIKKNQYFERQVLEKGIPVKDGARELLERLKCGGIPTALATSTVSTAARKRIAHAGLDGFLEVLCFGDEVQQGKPAPDLFLLAASRLGVNASNCLVLEDSHAGIEAALAAGMQAIMVPDLLQPEPWVMERGATVKTSLVEVGRCFQ